MATVGIMTFLLVWGEYPFATILLESNEKYTVSIVLVDFISTLSVYWNQMAAASVIVSLPVLVMLILAQRYLIQGLTSGAVK